MEIEKRLLNHNYTAGVVIKPKYVVIHETDNTDKGANADAHYRYWTNNDTNTSVHFVVDDTKIIQLLELNQKAWHVGDNKNHSDITNSNSIGIELCVNSDGNFETTRQNGVWLVKYLLPILKLSYTSVVRHYDASGKHCPSTMIDNSNMWQDFISEINQVENKYSYDKTVDNMIVDGITTKENMVYWEKALRGEEPLKPEFVRAILDRYHSKLV